MKIECTSEEFKILMDLVYAGNLLINGTKSSEKKIKPYQDMEQAIFKIGVDEHNLGNCVEYSDEFGEYMPTREYEDDTFNEYIDEYDTSVFYDELVMRLAARDARNHVGDIDREMSKADFNRLELELEEKYETEIEINDLMNLKVVTWPEVKDSIKNK